MPPASLVLLAPSVFLVVADLLHHRIVALLPPKGPSSSTIAHNSLLTTLRPTRWENRASRPILRDAGMQAAVALPIRRVPARHSRKATTLLTLRRATTSSSGVDRAESGSPSRDHPCSPSHRLPPMSVTLIRPRDNSRHWGPPHSIVAQWGSATRNPWPRMLRCGCPLPMVTFQQASTPLHSLDRLSPGFGLACLRCVIIVLTTSAQKHEAKIEAGAPAIPARHCLDATRPRDELKNSLHSPRHCDVMRPAKEQPCWAEKKDPWARRPRQRVRVTGALLSFVILFRRHLCPKADSVGKCVSCAASPWSSRFAGSRRPPCLGRCVNYPWGGP